jgi:hypothetical protein
MEQAKSASGIAAGDRGLERVDVDPQAIELQPDTIIAASQGLSPDRPPGEMHGFA